MISTDQEENSNEHWCRNTPLNGERVVWQSASCRQPARAVESQRTGHSTEAMIQRNGHSTWLTPAAQEDESADATRSRDNDDFYSAAINRRGRPARQAGRSFRSPDPFSSIARPPALCDPSLLHSTAQPPATDAF